MAMGSEQENMHWENHRAARHSGGTFGSRLRLVAAGLAVAACVAGASAPASALTAGDKVTHHLTLGSKQIPLPEGEWIVAGFGTQEFEMEALGAFGTIQTAILFLANGNRIDAMLEVNTNSIPINDGWGRTRYCAEGRQLQVVVRYLTGWETSCSFVETTSFSVDSTGPAAWIQARDYARQAGLALPSLWLTAGFRVSDRQDLIDARYHFNPALTLGASASSLVQPADWSPDAVSGDAARLAAVEVIASWASGFDAWVERGLRNQLDDKVAQLPQDAAYSTSQPFVDAKLASLDSLYAEGRIGWDAYLAQSQKATTEVPVYKKTTSLISNSVKKNISFRTFGTLWDYGIAYVVTYNTIISTGIALTINITDSFWFVLNDQYWDDYYAKLNTHDSERIVDFTYVGTSSGLEASAPAEEVKAL